VHESPWLNLYLYPPETDYERSQPLASTWQRVGSSVRENAGMVGWPSDPRPAVYLSLGSLGSADVALMQGLIDTLAETDYLVVVSMGPQHDQLRLADNMIGEEFLPQPAILPHVDAVITHGGNNTVTESLHFGKPMVLLPLFWDQHDNAQRMEELGLGRRLATYAHEPAELIAAIESLLADPVLPGRLSGISHRLGAKPGRETAGDLILGLIGG
jgi:MGT family glycosyltransferase